MDSEYIRQVKQYQHTINHLASKEVDLEHRLKWQQSKRMEETGDLME